MKTSLIFGGLLLFIVLCSGQSAAELHTFPELDPELRYTFKDLAGRKAVHIPFPQIKSSLTFEARIALSIRPDGWVEQVRILYPSNLNVNHKRKIIKKLQKWRFSQYAGSFNHPTEVGIWFYPENAYADSDWIISAETLARGLNGRKLIFAPHPLPAERSDTVSLDLYINAQGEVTRVSNIEALTPTYRSTSLLKHRAAQVARRWKFESVRDSKVQRIPVQIPISTK